MRISALVLTIALINSAAHAADKTPTTQTANDASGTITITGNVVEVETATSQPANGTNPSGHGHFRFVIPGDDHGSRDGRTGREERAYWVPQHNRPMEKAAYLGVSTSPVPAVLREQLNIKKGMGLVVDFVEKDSPADAAGIKKFDILQKLNDQLLVDAYQLAVLVRTFKAGDEIQLTLVRQGQTLVVTAKLVEKEVTALEEDNPWQVPPMPWEDRPFPSEGTHHATTRPSDRK